MRHLMIILTAVAVLTSPLFARDLREAAVIAKKQLEESKKNALAVKARIRTDRTRAEAEIGKAQAAIEKLNAELQVKSDRIAELSAGNAELDQALSQGQTELDELSGAVRVAAGNLNALLKASSYTVGRPERLERLKPILDTGRFPGIDEMKTVADLFLEEMALNGGIDLRVTPFVSDTGETVESQVLSLGGFTSAYRLAGVPGFLSYSQDANRLYALAASPSRTIRKTLDRYMDGKTDSVFIDISRGGALKQLTHKQSLADQIEKGGMLVWPILALGVFAVIIGIERVLFLGKVHSNTDKVMGRVNELAALGAWEGCHNMVGKRKIPVYNVLRAGLNARKENRETLESILQESILKEMPKLERFLPMLNIMGAVAPLLGLLGTVTGMISTFHVITLYGTGDPRMMSGGISTALVTTMLGLAVAIPIMLLYTFLCRRVEHVIGDMEEKAVALTNIIFREAR